MGTRAEGIVGSSHLDDGFIFHQRKKKYVWKLVLCEIKYKNKI